MNVSFLTGSSSDAPLGELLVAQLHNICAVDSAVISAHRHPDKLRAYLTTTNFDIAIGAAGLAAHLPGAIASQQVKLTIGLPISKQMAGLDALLAILQMPFGIPVLTAGVDAVNSIVYFLACLARHRPEGLGLVVPEPLQKQVHWQREYARFQELANQWAIPHQVVAQPNPLWFNIIVISSCADLPLLEYQQHCPVVYVPILPPEETQSALLASTLLSWTGKGGLWLGVNNLRNALLSFMQLLNEEHLWDEHLWTIRRG